MKMLKNTVLALVIGSMMVQPVMSAPQTPLEKVAYGAIECLLDGADGVRIFVIDGYKFATANINLTRNEKWAVIGASLVASAITLKFFPDQTADLIKAGLEWSFKKTLSGYTCNRAFLVLAGGYFYKSVKPGL